ncbi:MAG: SseB family protein [Butyrivibrio sp.]|nr:SseB family protein [Butyrivibrio sp.]
MGLFDMFGKKNEKEAEEERKKELLSQKQEASDTARKAHEGMEWPVIQRINPVNIQDGDAGVIGETVPEERKDELGQMIYDEDIPADSLKFLNSQELLFILTALEMFNKKAPLPGFETNHRKIYNEVLGRIRDAKELYVLYDKTSGFPFIDHGFANVYFDEELAGKAVDLFTRQFRKLEARKTVTLSEDTTKTGFFDFLYYIGVENLIVDNGGYRARFKRSEITAAPGEWNNDKKPDMPINPKLNFAMIDFFEEMRWPVKYEKRDEVLKAKERRMLTLIGGSRFIVPIQHDGPAEVMEDGRIKLTKDSRIKFLVMKTGDNKEFIPVFTDGFSLAGFGKGKEFGVGVFGFEDLVRFVQDKDGVMINPSGQQVVLTRDRMMALHHASSQAQALKKKNSAGQKAARSADAAVAQAVNKAVKKMNEEKKD